MNQMQRQVAAVLADARIEALEERPSACAAINSVINRLVRAWSAGPDFDEKEFRAAANYNGCSDGTRQYGLLGF